MKKQTEKPAKAGRKQGRDTRFQPGQSGNPAGKRRGTRNKSTMAALALLDGEAEALTRKAIDEALGGNFAALTLCINKIIPATKERPLNITFPKVNDASDLAKLTGTLLSSVGCGEIDPGQAVSLSKIIDVHRGALEIADITDRIKKLEDEVKK